MSRTISNYIQVLTTMWRRLGSYRKTIIFMTVFLILILPVLSLSMANAQSEQASTSYISPTIESVYYNLAIYSPNNQTSYSKLMPLDFNLQWIIDRKPSYPYSGFYSYSLDNGNAINIESNQTANDKYASYQEDFKINPTFSYTINISSLTNGYHTLSITAAFYTGSNEIFNDTSHSFQFLVDNSKPTSSPTVPELTYCILLVVFAFGTTTAIALIFKKWYLSLLH